MLVDPVEVSDVSLLRSVLSGSPDDKAVDVSVGSLCDEDCAFVDDEDSTGVSLLLLLVLLDEDELDEVLVVCGTVLELEPDELLLVVLRAVLELLDDELEEVVSRAVDEELLLLDDDDVDDDVEELLVVVVAASTYSSLMDVIATPPLSQASVTLYLAVS